MREKESKRKSKLVNGNERRWIALPFRIFNKILLAKNVVTIASTTAAHHHTKHHAERQCENFKWCIHTAHSHTYIHTHNAITFATRLLQCGIFCSRVLSWAMLYKKEYERKVPIHMQAVAKWGKEWIRCKWGKVMADERREWVVGKPLSYFACCRYVLAPSYSLFTLRFHTLNNEIVI